MKKQLRIYICFFLIPLLHFYSCKAQNSNDNITSVTIANKGIGGNNTNDLLKRIDTDVVKLNPDLVILMVGTNDLLNSKKMISFEKYETNLNQIVKKIKDNKSQILLMSPPPVDSIYLFQRHDKNVYTQPPNVKMDSARQIIKRTANKHTLLFIDLFQAFKNKNIPDHNQDNYIRNIKNSSKNDGVHPTPLGYQFITDQITHYLKEKGLLYKYTNIVCFGDSITFGSGLKKGGTVFGENYPSYLYKILNQVVEK